MSLASLGSCYIVSGYYTKLINTVLPWSLLKLHTSRSLSLPLPLCLLYLLLPYRRCSDQIRSILLFTIIHVHENDFFSSTYQQRPCITKYRIFHISSIDKTTTTTKRFHVEDTIILIINTSKCLSLCLLPPPHPPPGRHCRRNST